MSKSQTGNASTLRRIVEHQRHVRSLSQIAGLLSWDQETMMPEKAATMRSQQASALAKVIHCENASPALGGWLKAINAQKLDDKSRANLREAQRAHKNATQIPPELAAELAAKTSQGPVIWAKARADEDYKAFAPILSDIIALIREEARCLAQDGQSAYEALLDQFEPAAKLSHVQSLLSGLKKPLVELSCAIAERPLPPPLEGHYPAPAQLALAHQVAKRIGYDFEAGRLDIAVHPFSSGSGTDTRITTRTDETDPLNCLYSTLHEVGHALYSQGTPDPNAAWADYCSMGVHESQSRFWENQIGRSREFADWLFPRFASAFPQTHLKNADAWYRSINRVERGFIRTEADEVHYNLHVLLRFELEQALIEGDLEVSDLEGEWNRRFEDWFGLKVPKPSLGVLQDVHWSAGLFGYFPTYAIGNVYAACLDQAMLSQIPNRGELTSKGTLEPVLQWLRKHVHAKGRLTCAPELIEQATGSKPGSKPLIDYLNTKFSNLYDL